MWEDFGTDSKCKGYEDDVIEYAANECILDYEDEETGTKWYKMYMII